MEKLIRRSRAQRRRFILGAIFTIPLVLLFSGYILSNVVSPSTGLHTFKGQGLQKITREHLANGTFWADSVQLNWLAEGESHSSASSGEEGR